MSDETKRLRRELTDAEEWITVQMEGHAETKRELEAEIAQLRRERDDLDGECQASMAETANLRGELAQATRERGEYARIRDEFDKSLKLVQAGFRQMARERDELLTEVEWLRREVR